MDTTTRKLHSNRHSGNPASRLPALVIHCDGACEPKNPGGCGTLGWVAYDAGVIPTAEAYGYAALGITPQMSNNVAEYRAVISALEWALSQGHLRVIIRTDSQLVVKQVNGEYRCNKPHLQELRDRARTLLSAVQGRIQWVPRESNEEADKLSRKAYREWCRTQCTEATIRVRLAA
jgi:ribonuclease HI